MILDIFHLEKCIRQFRLMMGVIKRWNNENQNWERDSSNKQVALKSLNNSQNVTLEFINEVKLIYLRN